MFDLGFFTTPRIRLVRQTEAAECGLAALTMIANFHGLDIDLGTMRRRYAPSLRGATLRSIMRLADQIGMLPRAVKLPLDKISKLHMPAILHWDMNHYVVIERFSNKKALIHNPDGRSQWMPISEVSNRFTGVALELRPTEEFRAEKSRERLGLKQLVPRIVGAKSAFGQIFVLSVILQVFALSLPFYLQLAIDSAVPALDIDLLTALAMGFGLFTLIQVLTTLLRSFALLSAGTTVAFGIASNVTRRLLRLPVAWFEKRHTGDILARFQSINPIQSVLTEGAIAALIDGAMAILTLIMLFWYNTTLAFIAVFSLLLYSTVRIFSFSFERSARESAIVAGGKEQTALMESLRGITTLRLYGREMLRLALWQTRVVDVVNANVRVSRAKIWQSTANALIFGMDSIVTIWLAISSVINGTGFSVGMVFAFLAYKAQFVQRSSALIDQAISFRMLNLHLERLSDIVLSDEDASFTSGAGLDTVLKGKIELRNVYYRYAPGEPIVLENVNLVIEPGEHIAITGPSGGGKSTLVKLILGLIEPEAGDLLIDGMSLKQFGYKSYHSQLAAVLQDDRLFSGSLADNIALFDEGIDMNRVHEATTMAAIHDDIEAMPMRYETLVGDMGSTLSGGQKQRVILARALYRKPKVMVVDEGTAHLDVATEQTVNGHIKGLGMTRVVIAHRHETINNADRIVVLENGRVQDRSAEDLVSR